MRDLGAGFNCAILVQVLVWCGFGAGFGCAILVRVLVARFWCGFCLREFGAGFDCAIWVSVLVARVWRGFWFGVGCRV